MPHPSPGIAEEHPVPRAGAQRSASSRSSGYLPTLDGWRAIAIFLVLCAHDADHLPPAFVRWTGWNAGDAVDLFFALSGFLICGRLLREEKDTGSISLRGFYLRRLFRLQPPALTYLAVVGALALAGVIPAAWDVWFASLTTFRNLLNFSTNNATWYTGHFWSLAAEEHFYLLFPALLLLVKRSRLTMTLLLTVALEAWHIFALHHAHGADVPLLFHRTDMLVGCMMLGCAWAVALERPRLRDLAVRFLHPAVALLYLLAVKLLLYVHHTNLQHALMITIYAPLFVATSLHPASLLSRFLELPPLRFIGRISYSLYLWQQFFFTLNAPRPPGSLLSSQAACWTGLLLASVASYFLLEKPSIRLGHRLAMRYTRSPAEAARPEPAATT